MSGHYLVGMDEGTAYGSQKICLAGRPFPYLKPNAPRGRPQSVRAAPSRTEQGHHSMSCPTLQEGNMPDIAYYWYGTLNIEQAMSEHERRTGQPVRQILCRNADQPAVAAQLRPNDVTLHANNYVQRGTLYLSAETA